MKVKRGLLENLFIIAGLLMVAITLLKLLGIDVSDYLPQLGTANITVMDVSPNLTNLVPPATRAPVVVQPAQPAIVQPVQPAIVQPVQPAAAAPALSAPPAPPRAGGPGPNNAPAVAPEVPANEYAPVGVAPELPQDAPSAAQDVYAQFGEEFVEGCLAAAVRKGQGHEVRIHPNCRAVYEALGSGR